MAMITINQLNAQYRKLCAQSAKLDQKRVHLQQELDSINQARYALINQIHAHKYLIDYCVITGHTPTQAQLSHNSDEIKQLVDAHYEQYAPHDRFLYNMATGSSLNSHTLNSHRLGSVVSVTSHPTILNSGP